jgi:RNA polymerase sigma factor (sigma-70 family)
MDVRQKESEDVLPDRRTRRPGNGRLWARRTAGDSARWVGELLGEWQAREIRIARSFPECRGLAGEQLEDLYQETALALLRRPYASEEHLRNALRTGIKHRALNLHRDERRHSEILARSAPGMHLLAEAHAGKEAPESVAVMQMDRLVVEEFLTELDGAEREVFGLLAEGMRYRAIAPVLGIEINEARNVTRAIERKRQRFQLLYDTGRLCGFRAVTIQALQSGEATSEKLAERAFAHLEGCAHCRAEHKTNARRLRASFQGQAAALLPFPALTWHVGALARLDLRVRSLLSRIFGDGTPFGTGGLRERAIGALASGGAATKVAIATVAVVGGTIGATHALESDHSEPNHHHRAAVGRLSSQHQTGQAPPNLPVRTRVTAPRRDAAVMNRRRPVRQAAARAAGTYEPGGFAYLGVPRNSAPRASAASVTQTSGGQFSP